MVILFIQASFAGLLSGPKMVQSMLSMLSS